MKLFITGFLQVFFVAINTYFLTKQYYIGMLVSGFLISFIWTFNVRKVVIGTMADRIIYSTGASLGGIAGLLIGILLANNL